MVAASNHTSAGRTSKGVGAHYSRQPTPDATALWCTLGGVLSSTSTSGAMVFFVGVTVLFSMVGLALLSSPKGFLKRSFLTGFLSSSLTMPLCLSSFFLLASSPAALESALALLFS